MKNKTKLLVILPVIMLSALVYTNHAKAVTHKASLKSEKATCGKTNCNCTDCTCGSSCACLICD